MNSLQVNNPIDTRINQVVTNEIVAPNTRASYQESFFSNSFDSIKNICYRNIKKINSSYLIYFGVAQVFSGIYYNNLFLIASGILTNIFTRKIMDAESIDLINRLNLDLESLLTEREIILEELRKNNLMQETPLKAYENLQCYSKKVDGNIETIILQTPIKDVDKVVYYDKQFYDYNALAVWCNLSNSRSKLCPHNRQPLILDNLLRVDKQNII